jgi:RHS repeat-associated protein
MTLPVAYATRLCIQPHFTGKERDTESGNDYFGDRYFASTMGRFLSPDPGPWKLNDPQYFNMYSYALNNPLRNVDEEGDTAQDRVNKANELASQNIPYVSGGGHPGNKMETCGLDCSGLVHTVFKADPDNTLSVNGSAATEATQFQDGGQFSTDIGDAQPGDAIFFSNSSGTIVHTGIVVDVRDGKVYFVHAPRPGKNVNRFYIKVSDLKLGDEKFAGLGRSNERGTTPTAQNKPPSLNLWSAFMGFFIPEPPPPAAPKPPSENPHRHKGPVPCLKHRDGSCAS